MQTNERGALRPAEAAKWLGVSRDTLDRLCARGEIRRIKVGAAVLISMAELQRFVESQELVSP